MRKNGFLILATIMMSMGLYGTTMAADTTVGTGMGVAYAKDSKAEGERDVAIGGKANATSGTSTAVGYGANATGGNSTAVGYGANATGGNSTAVGYGAVAKGQVSTALGFGANSQAGNSIAIGQYANNATDTSNGGANAIAIGYGAKSYSQSSIVMGSLSYVGSGSRNVMGSAQTKYGVVLGAASSATADEAIVLGYNSRATGVKSLVSGAGAIATADYAASFGATSRATASKATAVGYSAQATIADSVALGADSKTAVDMGVTGYLADGDISSTWVSTKAAVSVGDVGNNVTRQITSVAAGTEDTDAVNVAQLKASQSFTEAGRNIQVRETKNANKTRTYTVALADDINLNSVTANTVNVGPVTINSTGLNVGNTKITGVADGEISATSTDAVNGSQLYATNKRIDGLHSEITETGAMSAALAGLLPMQYDTMERHQFMAALGHYRDKQAIAMGFATYPRENTLLHAGIAYGGSKYMMMNAGATFKFGRSEYAKDRPAQYGDGPISSIYVLQDENTVLKAKVAEQDQVISSQSARLDSQEARIAQLEALVQNLVK